jgi:hypothetical protein
VAHRRHFVTSTRWLHSYANDALFVWLLCDRTPRYTIDEVCTDSGKKMAVDDDSVMVGLLPLRPIQRWVFAAPTQWQDFCANDALFVWLMHNRTPRYTIDEVCTDSWKKMAVRVDSIMVLGLLQPFQRCDFVAPAQWRNSCANDALFVWLLCDRTPRDSIYEVCTDSRKIMAVGYCDSNHSRREFLWSPRNDKILVQMMLFSFGSCVIILPDIL